MRFFSRSLSIALIAAHLAMASAQPARAEPLTMIGTGVSVGLMIIVCTAFPRWCMEIREPPAPRPLKLPNLKRSMPGP